MPARHASPSDAARDRCPRCGAPDATLNLLTSMTKYFACRHCACRWQVSVGDEAGDHATGERDDADVRRSFWRAR